MKNDKKSQFNIGDLYDPEVADMPEKERGDNMESISYSVKQRSYTKNLDEDELHERKTELAEVSIKLHELDEKKKNVCDEIKLEAKEPKAKKMVLLETIKHSSERRNGIIYGIDDQENGLMYSFDQDAVCIEVRGLNKDERQTFLKINENTGTDGN